MKFNYNFRYVCKGTTLVIDIEPNTLITGNIDLIDSWLRDDVMSDFDEVRTHIDAVINGEKECYERGGNANFAEIHQDTSTISCFFDELDYEPCTLPTQMLREILDIWEAEYNKFYGKNKETEMPKKKKGIFGIFNK